jgi:hypothetical protein
MILLQANGLTKTSQAQVAQLQVLTHKQVLLH